MFILYLIVLMFADVQTLKETKQCHVRAARCCNIERSLVQQVVVPQVCCEPGATGAAKDGDAC